MPSLENFLLLVVWTWFFWFAYITLIDSHRKGRKQVERLRKSGFRIDQMLKGNVYVLLDHTRRKVAFVFRDRSIVYDYEDVKSLTRYWVTLPLGPKLRNTIVFALRDVERPFVRIGRLSAKQAEYWHVQLARHLRPLPLPEVEPLSA